MRKYTTILFLIIAMSLSAQRVIKSGGKWIGGLPAATLKTSAVAPVAEEAPAETAIILFFNDFDRTPNTEYSDALMDIDYIAGSSDNTYNVKFLENSGDTVLRSKHQLLHGGNATGGDMVATLRQPDYPHGRQGSGTYSERNDIFIAQDSVWMSYNIRFSANWTTGLANPSGGSNIWNEIKLPGLKTDAGGGIIPNAYVRPKLNSDYRGATDESDSANYFAWYKLSAGEDDETTLSQIGDYNDTITPGVWHNLVLYVRMNTASNHDGAMGLWLDGNLVGKFDTVRFDLNTGLKWSSYLKSTFRGGSGYYTIAPNTTAHVDIDDQVIYLDTAVTPFHNDFPLTYTPPWQSNAGRTDHDLIYIAGMGDGISARSYEVIMDSLQQYNVFTLSRRSTSDGTGFEESIDEQLAMWEDSLTSTAKQNVDYVVLAGLGMDDARGGADSATIVNDYIALLAAVSGDLPVGAKVIAFTSMPSKGGTGMTDAEHDVLKAVNSWLITTPANVDYVSTSNWSDYRQPSGDSMIVAYTTDRVYPDEEYEYLFEENLAQVIDSFETGLLSYVEFLPEPLELYADNEFFWSKYFKQNNLYMKPRKYTFVEDRAYFLF